MDFIRKNCKKNIIGVLIIIVVIGLFGGAGIKTDGYSVDNVYNTIKELSSDKYEGRLHGTEGDRLAVNYIANEFEKIGLKPAGDNGTYLMNYNYFTKVNRGTPVLELIDNNGKIVKTYEYGKDYTESGNDYDIPGEITSGYTCSASYLKGTKKADNNKLIKMTTVAGDEQSFYGGLKEPGYYGGLLKEAGYKALLVKTNDNVDLTTISGFINNRTLAETGNEISTINIKQRACDELEKYEKLNYKLHLRTVIDVVGTQESNVIGYIPGRTNECLLITAHLDHVGTAPDGTIYPGALDNASGIAGMLEIAWYIKSQGKKPNKNIVFIAFNAEEAGDIGSSAYVNNPKFPLAGTTVLNLDMIGANKDIGLGIMASNYDYVKNKLINPSSKLQDQLKRLCKELGYKPYVYSGNSSDHWVFNLKGVSAVTLIDYDKDKIHTPFDDISNISKGNIDRALKLSLGYTNFTAYSPGILRGNSIKIYELTNFLKLQYPLLVALLVLILLGYFYYHNILKKQDRKKLRFPIVTIILVILICGLISYLPIIYPYVLNYRNNAYSLLKDGLISMIKSFIVLPNYFGYFCLGAAILVITKRRIINPSYKGDGSEYNMMYYISAFTIVIASIIGNCLLYNKELYYPATPDFGRGILGKIILHLVLALIAYIIFKFARLEAGGKEKGYKSLAAFSLIFFLFLSAFYMPIIIINL